MEILFQPQSMVIPLTNAIVDSSDGLVLAGDLVYFHFGRFPWNLREPRLNPKNCEQQRRIEKRLLGVDLTAKPRTWKDKAFVLGISPFAHNYYHFLTEIVPACLAKPELTLLIALDFPKAYQVFLRELGISTELVEADKVGIEQLWLPSCCEHSSESLAWLKDAILKSCRLLPAGSQKSSVINSLSRGYISRAKARQRQLQNEAEILPILERYGIDVVHFETLAIRQQIEMVQHLEWFIAPHGAGLANMLFLPKHAKVCEIRPTESSGQYCYEKMAKALGINYYWLLGERGRNFTLNTIVFENILEMWTNKV